MNSRCVRTTLLTIALLLMANGLRPTIGLGAVEEASILMDMGNGTYHWADMEIGENRTAINLAERAAEELGLEIELQWFSFGGFVKELGDVDCDFPRYWHFYNWDPIAEAWAFATVGMSDYMLEDGDTVGLYCGPDYSDWSSPLPVPTPVNRYPSTMFRGSLQNEGRGLGTAPESGRLKWDLDTLKLEIDSSPAVGWGTVFITGTNGFYAIDQETGGILWEEPGIKGMSSPALHDGKVFVGAADGRIYCLDAESGATIWRTMVQPNPWRQSITSSPKVAGNFVYIGTFNETGGNAAVVALNIENGSVEWRYETASVYASSPAIHDGVLYIGLAGEAVDYGMSFDPPHGVLALSASNGSLVWMYDTDERVMSSPLTHDNRIYFTSWDGYLYSIKTNGLLDWRKQIGASTSSPALLHDTLYVGTGLLGESGRLLALQADGTDLWEYQVDGPIQSSPLVADGKVYFATNELDGKVYCLDISNGDLVWDYRPEPTNYILSSPVLADGELFIASDNGHVYAFSKQVGDEQDPGSLGGVTGVLIVLALIISVFLIVMVAILARRTRK